MTRSYGSCLQRVRRGSLPCCTDDPVEKIPSSVKFDKTALSKFIQIRRQYTASILDSASKPAGRLQPDIALQKDTCPACREITKVCSGASACCTLQAASPLQCECRPSLQRACAALLHLRTDRPGGEQDDDNAAARCPSSHTY